MTTPETSLPAGATIYVANAGLVLTSPFLPHLFKTFGLTANGAWKDAASAARAPHLLQWLVDGASNAPEPALALNKLICGLPPSAPLDTHFEITVREQETCTQLLQAMLANWTVLAHSSIAALRETFLQREGKLQEQSDRWTLQVQRKTLDVLIDRIPWTFSVVYHPWMPKPIHVTW